MCTKRSLVQSSTPVSYAVKSECESRASDQCATSLSKAAAELMDANGEALEKALELLSQRKTPLNAK